MPKRQDQNRVGLALVMVQDDESGIAERDDQFAQIGFVFQWAANARLHSKQVELLMNRLPRALAGRRILFRKKLAATFQSASGPCGDDYS